MKRHYFVRDKTARNFAIAGLLTCFLLFSGCAYLFGFVAYYDPTTYKNLTDLKPVVAALYGTFADESFETLNGALKIPGINLKFAQMYEYEKGKGLKNIETTLQIKKLKDLFEMQADDYLKNGKWSREHLNNQKEIIAEAFDIAIQTERLKNKNW